MKSAIQLSVATLAAVLTMTIIGCSDGGGGKSGATTQYTLGGSVAGLTGAGLVLQDNFGDAIPVTAGSTSFTSSAKLSSGTAYTVSVLFQPAGQTCTVFNGGGTVAASVTSISVFCSQVYPVGGTISGLSSGGLVLQNNGGDNLSIPANATSFTFATPVATGGAYSVSVLSQPTGQTCSVTRGSGTATAAVTAVSIVCTQTFTVSGTITGLHRAGLVLQDNAGDDLSVTPNATSFSFMTPVRSNGAYAVSIRTQPTAANCTVSDGSGIAGANVTAVRIVCVGDWAWQGGSSTVGFNGGQSGVYGTLGVSSASNMPGGRQSPSIWKDSSGVTWMFGGHGLDSVGLGAQLNDLWKFDPKLGTTGQWTWVAGGKTAPRSAVLGAPNGAPGVYGSLGVAAAGNNPGGRGDARSWIDAAGNLWLFGGYGLDVNDTPGYMNDLWKFDPTVGQWAWMGGSKTAPYIGGQPGIYGTQGVAATANVPGGRYGAMSWTDAAGNFWLFAGQGADSKGTVGYLNDLWRYTPGSNATAGTWTWIGGTDTVPPSQSPFDQPGNAGVYGTLGKPDAANIPGGRDDGQTWVDATGNVWLFGGLGIDSARTNGYLNDLWMYNPKSGPAGTWTWMGGANVVGSLGGQPGVYGVKGIADGPNTPGARFLSAGWTDVDGNLWMSGGQGYDWTGNSGLLNDLWKYTPGKSGAPGTWTWVGGGMTVPPISPQGVLQGAPGVYGTLGQPAPESVIGGRYGAVSWTDSAGNLWLFGGQGNDATGVVGYLNDLWQFQP